MLGQIRLNVVDSSVKRASYRPIPKGILKAAGEKFIAFGFLFVLRRS
jgi:hypothetical protein